jgi:hypothetical protein
MQKVTIFESMYSKEPIYISVEKALQRIKDCKQSEKIDAIRKTIDKKKRDLLKQNLPIVLWSGRFPAERTDASIIEHSGLLVLDFDKIGRGDELRDYQTELISKDYIYACWVSPSADGLKALVKIAQPQKHRAHFEALREEMPDADKSGINESRLCFESCDPDIYINPKASVYKKIKEIEQIEEFSVLSAYDETFTNLLIWLSNRGDSFVEGERNLFLYKLASACSRFGIPQETTEGLFLNRFDVRGTDFTKSETTRTIRSAYKFNQFGTAVFERERLIDKITRKEVEVDASIYDENVRPRDVVYGEDVKGDAIKIYNEGYGFVHGVGVEILDSQFKMKRGEVTLLSGYGNYGKSSWMKWYKLLHSIKHNSKFAIFAPEDNPAQEFYHDLTEIYLGCDCTPNNPNRPPQKTYEMAYDFVSSRFFYIYPKSLSPTPAYVKERFLELIIKEGVDGCIIDPFNQMTNDYLSFGGRSDQYLEGILGDFDRFAVSNNVYFWIVAHPNKAQKDSSGNYPCPDVYDLAGGAMWNNKMYNILIYHRQNHQLDPTSTSCELHTKKIKRQKIVGKKCVTEFDYFRSKRRYIFDGVDPYVEAFKNF